MLTRIICPFHKGKDGKPEQTPSCVVYHDGFKCFSCGEAGTLKRLDIPGIIIPKPRLPEDIAGSMARIRSLPCASVRGLSVPVDNDSYYIVWPGANYYKRRRFISDGGSKYLCPTGHSKPLFVPYEKAGCALAIVEGEINALSLASLKPKYSVCSPGGSADFFGKNFERYKRYYLTYSVFLVIVDKDAAGVEAAIKLKKLLVEHSPYIEVRLMSKDANELLVAGTLAQEVASWEESQGWSAGNGRASMGAQIAARLPVSTLKSS